MVVTRLAAGGRGLDWEFGISTCKLVCIEWINKALLNSTGNGIQYLVVNHNGEEYEKECTYTYNGAPLLCNSN